MNVLETILCIIAVILLLDILVRVVAVTIALPVFERRLPFDVQHVDPDPTAENFQVTTSDGYSVHASLFRTKKEKPLGVILFCPELGGNRWSAMNYGYSLREAGFHLVAFDFCNQGDSDHRPNYESVHWLTDYEVDDALAVLNYIESQEEWAGLPLGILGVSRGGATALATAASHPEVAAVACEGAYSNTALTLYFTYRWASLYVPDWLLKPFPVWHIRLTIRLVQFVSGFRKNCRYTRIEHLLPRLRDRHTLLIAGERDSYVDVEITKEIARRMAKPDDTVWVVAGAKHNMARSVRQNEYDERIVEFFEQITGDLKVSSNPLPETCR